MSQTRSLKSPAASITSIVGVQGGMNKMASPDFQESSQAATVTYRHSPGCAAAAS